MKNELQKTSFAIVEKGALRALKVLESINLPKISAPIGAISLSCRSKDAHWKTPFDIPALQYSIDKTHEHWEWTTQEEIRIDLLKPLDELECTTVTWIGATQGSLFQDQHLKQLHSAPIRGLDLDWSMISEAGLLHLHSFPLLCHLDIGWTKIHSRSLPLLQDCANLKSLRLNALSISAECIETLSNLPLEELHLNQCRITGLENLIAPNLKEIWLWDCAVSDQELTFLKHCTKLERLELRGTQFEGKFHSLRSLKNLQHINLSQTPVCNNLLAYLHDHPSLHILDIRETDIDSWNIENFQLFLSFIQIFLMLLFIRIDNNRSFFLSGRFIATSCVNFEHCGCCKNFPTLTPVLF